MVDFNRYRCRNCSHYHLNNFINTQADKCNKILNRLNELCQCVNWESSDNLVYLEQLSEKKDKV